MVPAGPSNGYHAQARQPSSGAHGPNSTDGESYSHFREDTPVLFDPPRQPRRKSSRIWSSVARAFLQRTIAYLKRQPKQASQYDSTLLPGRGLTTDQGNLPLSYGSPRLVGRNVFPSLTRLVLKGTNDVSFSPSSFFRTVEEVHALCPNTDDSTAPSAPLPPCRPQLRPRRHPPPPVDEPPARATLSTPSLSRDHTSTRAQAAPRKSSMKTEFDSMLELQALAMELEQLDPLLVNSPPLAPHRLNASPSIKSTRPRSPLWSTSPPAALNLGYDPLAELLAVADELKTMKNPDSDDILYMTDVPPPSPLPPTLHAFLDAPGVSLRILEMDIHSEDETFLGVPIPCIVVTSEGDALPTAALEVLAPPPSLSEDLLAPPPTTYRGRIETDQPPIISDECECDSPSPSPRLRSCEGIIDGKVEMEGSLSSPCDCSECPLGDANLSWEAINILGSSAPYTQYMKPDRPTAPKPTPLLRRRERSLLRRLLRGSDVTNAPPAEDRPQCIHSKQKWKRIPKEAIGSPRPLSPASQAVTILPHVMNLH
ncbi:hypothetical protein F5888DRAFT_1805190 [Russula emetica]|nr:hypothetical protein F5888DRAFT_1805190 [Russula emetica]